MAEDGHLTRDTALLIDMRQLTTLPSFEDLRTTMLQARADGMLPRAVAFVAGPPEQSGVGRQSEMLLPPTYGEPSSPPKSTRSSGWGSR